MESFEFIKGTKEYLGLEVGDRLNNLDTLVGTNPTFYVRREGEDDWIVQSAAQIDTPDNPMLALCLIDTTNVAYTAGHYELFLGLEVAPEQPLIGPVPFKVAT